MTEDEWLACADPISMLSFLEGTATKRGIRLLACGCCRLIWNQLTVKRSRRAVEIGELYADDPSLEGELARVRTLASQARMEASNERYGSKQLFGKEEVFRLMALTAVLPSNEIKLSPTWSTNVFYYTFLFGKTGPNLIREVFGNPFRPTTIDPTLLTSTVLALARGIYQDRTFQGMPILADALQDAGCEQEQVLNHCRSEGVHVRGCWLLDLLLKKE